MPRLRSGMALQVDVIPAASTPYHTTSIEDGIAWTTSRYASLLMMCSMSESSSTIA